jgi:hypothetical protein
MRREKSEDGREEWKRGENKVENDEEEEEERRRGEIGDRF